MKLYKASSIDELNIILKNNIPNDIESNKNGVSSYISFYNTLDFIKKVYDNKYDLIESWDINFLKTLGLKKLEYSFEFFIENITVFRAFCLMTNLIYFIQGNKVNFYNDEQLINCLTNQGGFFSKYHKVYKYFEKVLRNLKNYNKNTEQYILKIKDFEYKKGKILSLHPSTAFALDIDSMNKVKILLAKYDKSIKIENTLI
jgi:hypothetical protein